MENSLGYSGMSTKILKLRMLYISSPLTCICNKVTYTGTFPTRFKFSEIQSLFKKYDKTTISNYRPISLLTTFSNVFEKFIYRIYHHIHFNHVLMHEHFGFRNNSSTEMSSYKLVNDILS
jgi:Notch-like protein